MMSTRPGSVGPGILLCHSFMGLRLDAKRNVHPKPDADVARPDSPARILVIHTQEEMVVARETRRAVANAAPRKPGRT